MKVQFTRDTIPLIRQILPVGIDGCRGVFATPDLGEWWDDPKKVWPDEAERAAILLPDGRLLGEGQWVESDDDGVLTIVADK